MFSKERPYRFHLELTDKCNAGCPMCSRTDPANFCKANDKVQKLDLTLADFERHFTPEFCARTEHIELGGGLGDPLAARDCLEICDHLTRYGVNLVVSTNGGLRNTQWWEKLGHILQRTDSVVQLHVDGLKDTNPLYRVNTDFDKIMANAQAYLATGAPAEWYYILFRHNEHQVEEARDLSRRMGFRNFVLIDTIRFGKRDSFPYRLPNGEWHALEPATLTSADFEKKFQQEASSSKSQGASLPLSPRSTRSRSKRLPASTASAANPRFTTAPTSIAKASFRPAAGWPPRRRRFSSTSKLASTWRITTFVTACYRTSSTTNPSPPSTSGIGRPATTPSATENAATWSATPGRRFSSSPDERIQKPSVVGEVRDLGTSHLAFIVPAAQRHRLGVGGFGAEGLYFLRRHWATLLF